MKEAAAKYDPFSIVVPVEPGDRQSELARMLPFISAMEMRDGRATAYVCHDFTCTEPDDRCGWTRRTAVPYNRELTTDHGTTSRRVASRY